MCEMKGDAIEAEVEFCETDSELLLLMWGPIERDAELP